MDIEEQKQQWQKELETNESIQKYFSQFSPVSVKMFIEMYVFKKSMWLQYGKNYVDSMETDGVKWVYEAFEHLKTIQQKKLFDVQCLWRAEKLIINEVQICEDFLVWEKDILNCPFIEPVTMEDIEIYQLYLQQENKEELDWTEDWQDYEEIIEAYNTDNENRNFPDWYEFHNGKTGKGVLLTLPDIRGEKEEFYLSLTRQKWRKDNAEKEEEAERKREKRPIISISGNTEWFVNTFENKEVRALYKAYEWNDRNSDKEEALEEDLELLFSADEPVPIAAHHDWMEAIKIAAEKYKAKKIIEAIPQAWEEYLINIKTGIAFERERSSYREVRDMQMEDILEGRVLNGEPADLNF